MKVHREGNKVIYKFDNIEELHLGLEEIKKNIETDLYLLEKIKYQLENRPDDKYPKNLIMEETEGTEKKVDSDWNKWLKERGIKDRNND